MSEAVVLMVAFFVVSLTCFDTLSVANASTNRQNDYPIVLVHGLAGFDKGVFYVEVLI